MKITIDTEPKYAYGFGWNNEWEGWNVMSAGSNKPMKITKTTPEEWAEIFNAGYL